MASPGPQGICHFAELLVVDRGRAADRHQCERCTLGRGSTYMNYREVKQRIRFHVEDEEDQVVLW